MPSQDYDKLKQKQSDETLKELQKELRQSGHHLNRRLIRYKWVSTEKITSRFGLKIRQIITPPIARIVTRFCGKKIHKTIGDKLDKNKSYIFCSTHSFTDDVMAAFSVLDRNAFLVLGSSQTLELNWQAKFLWLNGLIFVDLMDSESRQQVVPKAKKIISMGGSILIFPEGCWNIQESGIIANIFNGAYQMARETGAEIVPIGSYHLTDSKEIFVERGNPFNLSQYDNKDVARDVLREALASLRWQTMLRATEEVKRADLSEKDRILYYLRFRNDVLTLPWIRDSWSEEINYYVSKHLKDKREVLGSLGNVELTRDNAFMAKELLAYKQEKADLENYELIRLLIDTWQMNTDQLLEYVDKTFGIRLRKEDLMFDQF